MRRAIAGQTIGRPLTWLEADICAAHVRAERSLGNQQYVIRPSRRTALIGAAVSLYAPWGWVQPARKIFRLAGLTPILRSATHWIALVDELRRNGFVEGTNITIVGFGIEPDRLDAAAAEFVNAGVDAILSGGVGPTRAAQRATSTTPILTALDDFVDQGFVASLARPGGNITGISILGPALDGKRQEILIDVLPNLRRIAILADPGSTPPANLLALHEAGRQRGVDVLVHRAGRREEIAPAIDAARAAGAEALNVLASQLFNVNRSEIIAHIRRLELPAIYQWPEWVGEGALIAYGPRFATVYRQLARQLVKVLNGAKPAEIPVEQPTAFELVINLRIAKAMRLTIPSEILLRADSVIE